MNINAVEGLGKLGKRQWGPLMKSRHSKRGSQPLSVNAHPKKIESHSSSSNSELVSQLRTTITLLQGVDTGDQYSNPYLVLMHLKWADSYDPTQYGATVKHTTHQRCTKPVIKNPKKEFTPGFRSSPPILFNPPESQS